MAGSNEIRRRFARKFLGGGGSGHWSVCGLNEVDAAIKSGAFPASPRGRVD